MNSCNTQVPGILSQLLNLRAEICAVTSHLWFHLRDTWHRLTLKLQAELLRQLLAEAAKCIDLPATKLKAATSLQHRQTQCPAFGAVSTAAGLPPGADPGPGRDPGAGDRASAMAGTQRMQPLKAIVAGIFLVSDAATCCNLHGATSRDPLQAWLVAEIRTNTHAARSCLEASPRNYSFYASRCVAPLAEAL